MHFIRHQHEIQKATAGPWTQMNGLLQMDYSVFSNMDVAKKAEHTQRNMQKAQMTAVALSPQRPPTRRLPFPG